VPLLPDVPDEPLLPDVPLDPEVPELPDVPSVPLDPDVPELPLVPLDPLVPLEPLDPDEPELPDVPEDPLDPDVPLEPDVPELPDVPLEPDAPDVVFDTTPLASTVKKVVLLALDDKFKICNGCVAADELIIRLPVIVVDCKIAIIHSINIKQFGYLSFKIVSICWINPQFVFVDYL